MTACAVGPNFHHPCPPPCVKRYAACPTPKNTVCTPVHGGESQCFIRCGDIPGQWWYLFHSEPLNDLICRGIANSPTLEAARAALVVAEQNLRVAIGNIFFPAVDGSFSATRQRFSLASIGDPRNQSTLFNIYNASVAVTYDLDVFGGGRRQVEATAALAENQCFLEQAAFLTLTSNIVTTAITEASLRAQVEATCELVRVQEDLLALTEKRFDVGGVSGTDVLAQRTELAQTRALLPPLQKSLEQTRHALAVLVGSFPCEASCLPCFELDELDLPKCLPISLPSKLVCQRPDVRAAEALLHQATANIGVATANMLPKFPLTANYGTEANRISDLFSGQAVVWSIMGQVIQPIFHGGALVAARRAAIAAQRQAFAKYKEIVLKAFQEVADVLRALDLDAKTLQAQRCAEVSAKATLKIVEKQYAAGGASYLNILDAKRQYQQAVINRVQAQALRYTDTAALFQALGGGWWNRPCDP